MGRLSKHKSLQEVIAIICIFIGVRDVPIKRLQRNIIHVKIVEDLIGVSSTARRAKEGIGLNIGE